LNPVNDSIRKRIESCQWFNQNKDWILSMIQSEQGLDPVNDSTKRKIKSCQRFNQNKDSILPMIQPEPRWNPGNIESLQWFDRHKRQILGVIRP
jgi:hypothetical protein